MVGGITATGTIMTGIITMVGTMTGMVMEAVIIMEETAVV